MKNEAYICEMNEQELETISGGCLGHQHPHHTPTVRRPRKVIKWVRVGLLLVPVVVTVWM